MKEVIKTRATIRFNPDEQAKLDRVKQMLNEDDNSKAVKFCLDWTLNHIDYVTDSLISPDWQVVFTKKTKQNRMKRRIYP